MDGAREHIVRNNLIGVVSTAPNVTLASTAFRSFLTEVLENFVPTKRVKNRVRSRPPWLGQPELRCVNERDKSWKKLRSAIRLGLPTSRLEAEYRKKAKRAAYTTKAAKSGYIQRQFAEVSTPADFWKSYRKVAGKRMGIPDLKAQTGNWATASPL